MKYSAKENTQAYQTELIYKNIRQKVPNQPL